MIVEDEFLIAMDLEITLRSAGYEVLGPAHTVGMALALLKAERPDAAVLDVDLAGQWVTPVAEVLQAMLVPFVVASAFSPADLQAEPILRKAINVGKPTSSRRLLSELEVITQK